MTSINQLIHKGIIEKLKEHDSNLMLMMIFKDTHIKLLIVIFV